MPDLTLAYLEAQRSMSDIARALDAEVLASKVPACPDWSVKDLLGHVTGIATALSTGAGLRDINLVAFWDPDVTAAREEFVDAEVRARRHHSIEQILQEWDSSTAALTPMLQGDKPFPDGSPALAQWVVTTDVGVHHHDLRGAVGMPADRDSLATGLSLRSYVEAMKVRTGFEGLPILRIVAGSRSWTLGDAQPAATVTADAFELARAAAGRRSPEQIRAYQWEGDPEPFMRLFYPNGLRTEPLVE